MTAPSEEAVRAAMRQLYTPDQRSYRARTEAALAAAYAVDRAEIVTEVGCEDCARPYGDHGFPDLIIPLYVWKRISTHGDETGLLCPSCICARLGKAGISSVEGAFMSGPIEPVSRATMYALRGVENLELRLDWAEAARLRERAGDGETG